MHLQGIELLNFKNYVALTLEFGPEINCFVGANGVGKTNLLDAVHYLSLTKSAFQHAETHNITHYQSFLMAKGDFEENDKTYTVACSYQPSKGKTVMLNRKEYEKISEHIGRFPCVLVSPDDTDLVREGSETRRRFFDGMLCQLDQPYLQALIRYNHALKNRNALLKNFADGLSFDKDLLLPYNQLLIENGRAIHGKRKQFIQSFEATFQEYYRIISQGNEQTRLHYQSDLMECGMEKLLDQHLEKDLILQRTTKGIHRDDYLFETDGHPLKRYGSQGQRKSYVIALRIAQFFAMKKALGKPPLLLLDDIFDKLDDQRIRELLNLMSKDHFGQVFITDARPERSEKLLKGLKKEVKFFRIEELNSSNTKIT